MPRVPVPAAPSADSPAAPPSAALPDTGFLRQPQVLSFVPISKSTLWRRVHARTFPEPVKLSERVTVWRAEDIPSTFVNGTSVPVADVDRTSSPLPTVE